MRITILLLVLSVGCTPNKNPDREVNPENSTIRYAKGFSIRKNGSVTEVTVSEPYQGATEGYTYWLVPRGQAMPTPPTTVRVVYTPVERIVCTSTTHIPLLDYLEETSRLVAFPTTDYISSTRMRARIDAGDVAELGVDKGLNIELLAALQPDLVMAYSMTGDYGQFKKIEELKIPVVLNAEYLEEHPLGRAEWIKFMALFFNKEEMADSVFNVIEENYLSLQEQVAAVQTPKPSVVSGVVYGDAWFLPGGQNYAAKLLRDAGFDYLWSNDSTTGFLQLSFEAVYEKAHRADYWIGVGTYSALEDIRKADGRYTKLKAFTDGNVYSSNARLGARGGSEFLELGYLRPDIILRDLVTISHPELLPGHEFYFHKKLE